jgi:hypothetical protein
MTSLVAHPILQRFNYHNFQMREEMRKEGREEEAIID